MKLFRSFKNLISFFALLFLLFVVWELAVRAFEIPRYILPPPSAVMLKLAEPQVRKLLISHSGITVLETFLGLTVSVFVGMLLSYAMVRFPRLYKTIYPLLVLSQTLPTIVIAPLLMIVLGFGMMTKVVVVTLYCFFPVTIGFCNGMHSIDRDYLTLMRTLHAGFNQIFFKVQMRWGMPGFFGGLKIAATYSVSGAVVSEFFGSSRGLGIFMRNAFSSSRTDVLFLIVFTIVILSVILVGMVMLLEYRICHRYKN